MTNVDNRDVDSDLHSARSLQEGQELFTLGQVPCHVTHAVGRNILFVVETCRVLLGFFLGL